MAIVIALLGFNDLGRGLFTIISTLPKNDQKIDLEVKNNSRFLSIGHEILPSCGSKVRETMVTKCELVSLFVICTFNLLN